MKNIRDYDFEFGSIAHVRIGTWTKSDGERSCDWCGKPFLVGQRVQDTTTKSRDKIECHTLVHINNDYCDRLRAERNKDIAAIIGDSGA